MLPHDSETRSHLIPPVYSPGGGLPNAHPPLPHDQSRLYSRRASSCFDSLCHVAPPYPPLSSLHIAFHSKRSSPASSWPKSLLLLPILLFTFPLFAFPPFTFPPFTFPPFPFPPFPFPPFPFPPFTFPPFPFPPFTFPPFTFPPFPFPPFNFPPFPFPPFAFPPFTFPPFAFPPFAFPPFTFPQVAFQALIPCFLMTKVASTLAVQPLTSLAALPFLAVIQVCCTAPLSTPLDSTPLHSSLLHSSPLLFTPLFCIPTRFTPVLSTPLLSSALHPSPLHSSPFHSSPPHSTPPLSAHPPFFPGPLWGSFGQASLHHRLPPSLLPHLAHFRTASILCGAALGKLACTIAYRRPSSLSSLISAVPFNSTFSPKLTPPPPCLLFTYPFHTAQIRSSSLGLSPFAAALLSGLPPPKREGAVEGKVGGGKAAPGRGVLSAPGMVGAAERAAGRKEAVVMSACAFGNSLTLPLVFLATLLTRADADRAAGYLALFMLVPHVLDSGLQHVNMPLPPLCLPPFRSYPLSVFPPLRLPPSPSYPLSVFPPLRLPPSPTYSLSVLPPLRLPPSPSSPLSVFPHLRLPPSPSSPLSVSPPFSHCLHLSTAGPPPSGLWATACSQGGITSRRRVSGRGESDGTPYIPLFPLASLPPFPAGPPPSGLWVTACSHTTAVSPPPSPLSPPPSPLSPPPSPLSPLLPLPAGHPPSGPWATACSQGGITSRKRVLAGLLIGATPLAHFFLPASSSSAAAAAAASSLPASASAWLFSPATAGILHGVMEVSVEVGGVGGEECVLPH
ncbi:unnamed protein product [Closterium sp. Naga37s-1]|nr:unnamed protein product [Closterium sp. Naga37s-1]